MQKRARLCSIPGWIRFRTALESMYENYKLCERLKPSDLCLVVEQYQEGKFLRKFHEHVPKSRLSEDARRSLLCALVMHFSGMGA